MISALVTKLTERNLRIGGTEQGCGVANVNVQKRISNGEHIVVSFTSPGGPDGEIIVPTIESAAIWIETMLRSDLYAELLEGHHRPLTQDHGEPQPPEIIDQNNTRPLAEAVDTSEIDRVERNQRNSRYSLTSSAAFLAGPDVSEVDRGLMWGFESGACAWMGPVCVGLRFQGFWRGLRQCSLDEAGEKVYAPSENMTLARFQLLLSAWLGFRLGNFRLGPMLGLGIEVDTWRMHTPEGSRDNPRGDVTAAFRLLGGIELSWHPHRIIGFRISGHVGWRYGSEFNEIHINMVPPTLQSFDGTVILGFEVRL